MGLDAYVRCNCAKEGKTKPFPFPGRLSFDERGEPFLRSKDETAAESMCQSDDLDELLIFDQWEYNQGCDHERYLVSTRIGNIAYVGYVRNWINEQERTTTPRFPILLKKVVYSGSHCGDCINSSEAGALLQELEILAPLAQDDNHRAFVKSMVQLCEASLASGNPIVF